MADGDKTRQELLQELVRLRQWVGDLHSAGRGGDGAEADGHLLALGQALSRVRDEVWRMRRAEDIEQVLEAVGDGLKTAGVPFLYCGVNVIDDRADPPAVTAYSMRQQGPAVKRWHELGDGALVDFWRGGKPVYRRDLHSEDPYSESRHIPAMRAVIDMPFSHGTLAVSSNQPHAFGARDLDTLENMAVVLSEGFRRLDDLQALERRNRALEQANLDLRRAQVQLVQSAKMAALGNLVAGIAHELNTPAGAIRSMCDTLDRAGRRLRRAVEQTLPAEAADTRGISASLHSLTDAGRVIADGSRRIEDTVRSLRQFARLDQSDMQLADLHRGLDHTLALLRPQLEGRIEIKRTYGEIQPIFCAPAQLNQVFMHLLSHCLETITGKGSIEIGTELRDGAVFIHIADDGRGIPADRLGRLFDISFATADDRVGLALGWAADEAVLRDHGGEIRVDSKPGAGTRVELVLPARDRPPA